MTAEEIAAAAFEHKEYLTLVRHIKDAVEEEREACAKLAECYDSGLYESVAQAIRGRSGKNK